jgi:type I restriction enzyme, R subunit
MTPSPLDEHNILQAIAQVNRVFEDKAYGLVIDYRGIFGEMNQALEIYAALEREGFDREDIEGALVDGGKRNRRIRIYYYYRTCRYF